MVRDACFKFQSRPVYSSQRTSASTHTNTPERPGSREVGRGGHQDVHEGELGGPSSEERHRGGEACMARHSGAASSSQQRDVFRERTLLLYFRDSNSFYTDFKQHAAICNNDPPASTASINAVSFNVSAPADLHTALQLRGGPRAFGHTSPLSTSGHRIGLLRDRGERRLETPATPLPIICTPYHTLL